MVRTEYVLFACHAGSYMGKQAGIIMHEHALPIAVSPSSYKGENPSEDGVCAALARGECPWPDGNLL